MVDIPSTSQADAAAPAIGSRRSSVLRRLSGEVARFGTVGLLAFILDAGVFNILRMGVLSDSPLTAKGISVIVATTFAYLANRHWTYADRARTGAKRETSLFFATNAAALLISWGCLAFSHYLLGLDSQLADNISANIIGVALGTLFRFWAYRTWVFPEVAKVDTCQRDACARTASANGNFDSGARENGTAANGTEQSAGEFSKPQCCTHKVE